MKSHLLGIATINSVIISNYN